MKVIGSIQPEFNSDKGRVVNPEYVNGIIVALSPEEANILKLLQDAEEGWNWDGIASERRRHGLPTDQLLDKAFWLVFQYVKSRFALNSFKRAVEDMEASLTILEGGNDE